MSEDEERLGLPWVGECNHLHKHVYVVPTYEDAVALMFLRTAGWFDNTGYCPAYFPRWLGWPCMPTTEGTDPKAAGVQETAA